MPEIPEPEAKPLSFEAGLAELEKVLKELDSGELPLERAVEMFERAVAISETCRKQLEEAESRVEILIKKAGKIEPEAFRPDKA